MADVEIILGGTLYEMNECGILTLSLWPKNLISKQLFKRKVVGVKSSIENEIKGKSSVRITLLLQTPKIPQNLFLYLPSVYYTMLI